VSRAIRENRLREREARFKQLGEARRCRLFESLLLSPGFPLAFCQCWHPRDQRAEGFNVNLAVASHGADRLAKI